MTTIDQITHPATPTPSEVSRAFAMTAAVAEAIRTAGQVPSGTLYATLVGRVSLEGYQKLIGVLKGAGLVSETAHMLTWVGPVLEVR